MARRQAGQGSLLVREDHRGREPGYSKVRVNGRQVKRALGRKRPPGSGEGLTKTEAEAALRRLPREHEAGPPAPVDHRTLAEVGESYLRERAMQGRRRSTPADYESYLRVHLVPFLGDAPLRKVRRADVDSFMALEAGMAPKSVRNYVGLLHSLFEYAKRREWMRDNPCRRLERPADDEGDADIRFLTGEELKRCCASCRKRGWGGLTGCIQGPVQCPRNRNPQVPIRPGVGGRAPGLL